MWMSNSRGVIEQGNGLGALSNVDLAHLRGTVTVKNTYVVTP